MLLECIRFRLTKFISKNKQVLITFPEEKQYQKIRNEDLDMGELPVKRALGVHWNIENDYLSFKIQLNDKPLTRRGMLSNS